MGFFDLNVPFLESSSPSDKALKSNRSKLAIKSMELGYTGIAYNRTIKGVMSDHDRCSIPLFSLSSLLKIAPYISSSVNLHRDLLGVPRASPFRQYSRITVCVDNTGQCAALNSGNPVLKSYDLVAVRPLNQAAFEDACQKSEVDIIAINFSEKLPFRLKLPIVKAAIGRGIYFEITYSHLIADVQVRRQMISNAKLLVDWTRGKNLIFSSAAPSVNELRGPCDVANLSSLLGLPMERAKAAISKNCRTVIANALRKKKFYKEAIRVEVLPSGEQFDSKEPWSSDWLKWDPISSGEGDLLLDDMAKSFSASSNVTKTVKAIDFASVIDSIPSHGFQVKDLRSETFSASSNVTKTVKAVDFASVIDSMPSHSFQFKDLLTETGAVSQLPDKSNNILSAAEVVEVKVTTNGLSEQPDSLNPLPEADQTSLDKTHSEHQTSGFENSQDFLSLSDTPIVYTNDKETRTQSATNDKEPDNQDGLDLTFVSDDMKMHDLQPPTCVSNCELNVVLSNERVKYDTFVRDTKLDATSNAYAKEEPSSAMEIHSPAFQNEDPKGSKSPDVGAQDVAVVEILSGNDIKNLADVTMALNGVSSHVNFLDTEQMKEPGDGAVTLTDEPLVVESNKEMIIKDDPTVANHEPSNLTVQQLKKSLDDAVVLDGYPAVESLDDMVTKDEPTITNHEPHKVTMEDQMQGDDVTEIDSQVFVRSIAGKSGTKRRIPHRAFLFPFKRMLNPIPFKKRSKKFKRSEME